jgi:hypothetical protein
MPSSRHLHRARQCHASAKNYEADVAAVAASVNDPCGWVLHGRGCFAVVAGVCSARADAIDGQWCLGSSHFEIKGPNIRTPGGNQIAGNYDRHGFTYVVPANEVVTATEWVVVERTPVVHGHSGFDTISADQAAARMLAFEMEE